MSEVLFQSIDGQRLDLLNLTPEAFSIETIAHALALKNRFTGHTRQPYTVAQHCVEGSKRIAGPYKLAFLLHELDEVFLPDIHGPLKNRIAVNLGDVALDTACADISWSDLGAQHERIALGALGLASLHPVIKSPEVKRMDWLMLWLEKKIYMKPVDWEWNFPDWFRPELAEDLELMDVVPMTWDSAEANFLYTFKRLVGV